MQTSPALSTPVPSPRLTLSWGGGALVLAALLLLASRTAFLVPAAFPSPLLLELLGPLSAILLVIAATILALGLRNEPGIAGASVVAKAALIIFSCSELVLSFLVLAPPRVLNEADYTGTASTTANSFDWVTAATWSMVYLGLGALLVASIIVARAGVLHGAARWALLALAVVTAVTLVADRVDLAAVAQMWFWGITAVPVVQLVVGVLFLVYGRLGRVAPRLQVAPEH